MMGTILYIVGVLFVMPELLTAKNTTLNIAGVLLMFAAGYAVSLIIFNIKRNAERKEAQKKAEAFMAELAEAAKEAIAEIEKKSAKKKKTRKTKKG